MTTSASLPMKKLLQNSLQSVCLVLDISRTSPVLDTCFRSTFGVGLLPTNPYIIANYEMCQYLHDLRRSRGTKKLYFKLIQFLDTHYYPDRVSFVDVQYLVNLLGDFPESLLHFSDFLPPGWNLVLSEDFERARLVLVIKDDKIVSRQAAFGLIDRDWNVNIKHSREATLGIRHLLRTALEMRERGQAVVTLRGGDAQCALLQTHELLASVSSWCKFTKALPQGEMFDFGGHEWRWMHRLFVKLAAYSDQVPPSLQLDGLHINHYDDFYYNTISSIYEAWVDGERVVAKRFHVFSSQPDTERRVLREVLFRGALKWKELHHPRLLPFLGLHRTVDARRCPIYFTISPWATYGNVRQCIGDLQRLGNTVPTDKWVMQIAEGLMYLHGSGVVHGALRGSNILIGKDYDVMLADFDTRYLWAARVRNLSLQHQPDVTRWLAPEALKLDIGPEIRELDDDAETLDSVDSSTAIRLTHHYPIDIYEFASVCVEIYSNEDPQFDGYPHQFRNLSHGRILMKAILCGQRPLRPERLDSDDLWALFGHCWSPQPEDRPVIQDIVQKLARIFPQISSAASKV